jgi:hypothetical protein
LDGCGWDWILVMGRRDGVGCTVIDDGDLRFEIEYYNIY